MMNRRNASKVPVAPEPVFTQDENRERRRQHLRVHYRGDFGLDVEVAAILGPLAAQLAAEPHPRAYLAQVEDVANAVHETVGASIGFIAEHGARDRVRHLHDRPGDRTKALRTISDLAPRPPAAVIGDGDLATGAWATTLIDLAKPYSAPLTAVLAAALPPDDDRLKGAPSTSERLVAELRALDRAAAELERRIERSKFYRRECPTPVVVDRREQDAHATLAELGVSL